MNVEPTVNQLRAEIESRIEEQAGAISKEMRSFEHTMNSLPNIDQRRAYCVDWLKQDDLRRDCVRYGVNINSKGVVIRRR